jgi:hypothetical protein
LWRWWAHKAGRWPGSAHTRRCSTLSLASVTAIYGAIVNTDVQVTLPQLASNFPLHSENRIKGEKSALLSFKRHSIIEKLSRR